MPLVRHHAALIYSHWNCGKYEQLRPVLITKIYRKWPWQLWCCLDIFPQNGSSDFQTFSWINAEEFVYSTDTSPPSCRPELRACSTNEYSNCKRISLHFDPMSPMWQRYFFVYLKKKKNQLVRIETNFAPYQLIKLFMQCHSSAIMPP